VFWWFQRGGKYLRYETRETQTGAFELRVITPDGLEHVETFSDSSDLTRRQLDFERDLASDGWTGPHGTSELAIRNWELRNATYQIPNS
jgi:hypothetical protein